MDVDRPGHARAGQVDEQAAREHGRGLGEIRVDALLPPVRAGRAQCELLGGPEDSQRLEVRRLEEHVGRPVGDLTVLAAHDRRERNGLLAVRDQQVALVEPPQRAVERAQLLVRACAAYDDPAVRELGAIEGVERASPARA